MSEKRAILLALLWSTLVLLGISHAGIRDLAGGNILIDVDGDGDTDLTIAEGRVANGGRRTPGASLDIKGSLGFEIKSVSNGATVNGSYNTATGGLGWTVYLPNATFHEGKYCMIKNLHSSASLTVKSNGGSIDGEAASTGVLLSAKGYARFISDGSHWNILDRSF